jgi:hypothetical protein
MIVRVIVLCLFAVIVRAQSPNEIEKTYNECKSQFDSLKTNNKLFSSKIFPLAIKIKKSMENDEISPLLTIQFKELKDDLPSSVRVIIWNEKTHIFNKYYSSEYLYPVSEGGAYDKNRRHVYTWVPGGRDSTGNWEFTTQDDGKTFLIRNIQFNEYMYAAIDKYKYDSSRRRVFTWRPGTFDDDCKWKVEIVSDSEIMLKTWNYNEYFYSGADNLRKDGYRRNVFTWGGSSACDSTCVWRLSSEGENYCYSYELIVFSISFLFQLFSFRTDSRRRNDSR